MNPDDDPANYPGSYYAVPYLRGCGELVVANTDTEFIGDYFVITVTAHRPEPAEDL